MDEWLGYQWDNPEITSLKTCQYHVAVEAERFSPKGEVGRFRFPPMVVAEVEMRGGLEVENFLRACNRLYGSWLPRERIRTRRSSNVLQSLDWSTVRARNRALRASRSIADPATVASRSNRQPTGHPTKPRNPYLLSPSFSEGTTPDYGTMTVDWAVSVGLTIPVLRFCSGVRGE